MKRRQPSIQKQQRLSISNDSFGFNTLKNASPEEWSQYREQAKQMNSNRVGLECLHRLRQNLPENTLLVGRVRKDAKLYFLPHDQTPKGRKKIYGPEGQPDAIPLPKWRGTNPEPSVSTNRSINQLRHELWADSIRPAHFSGFCSDIGNAQKPEKSSLSLEHSVFTATG